MLGVALGISGKRSGAIGESLARNGDFGAAAALFGVDDLELRFDGDGVLGIGLIRPTFTSYMTRPVAGAVNPALLRITTLATLASD